MKYFLIFKSFFQKTPNLIFFVTAKCNSKCKICFYWKNLGKKQNELTLDEIAKISKKAGEILRVSISGGEPFLRDDLEKICNLFYKNNKTCFITIPTNGLLPNKIKEKTEKIINLCNKANITIKLSLDGIGKIHDSIRRSKRNFDKVLETYNHLIDLKQRYQNLRICINTVVSSFNKNNIEELIFFVKSNLDIDEHSITIARGGIRDTIAKEVPIELLKKFYSLKPKRKRSFFQKLLEAKSQLSNKLILRILKEKEMPIHCLAGKNIIIITETGMVYPCEILGMPFGDLRKNYYDVKRLLNNNKAKDILKFIKDKKCYCTFECAISDSIIYNPKIYPLLLKEFIKYL